MVWNYAGISGLYRRQSVPYRNGARLLQKKVTRGRLILGAAICILAGCSASEQISTSATRINSEAIEIQRVAIVLSVMENAPEANRAGADIVKRAGVIVNEVKDIHAAVVHVTDTVPWWATLIKLGLTAAVIAGVIYLVSATGLATAVRVAIGWLPRKKQSEARMAVSVLDDAKPESVREWIAMKRGTDPEFDAAFRRAAQEQASQPDKK